MDKGPLRNKQQVLTASAIASTISTAITNPIEVAKLNSQYFPLQCEYYPHQSFRQLLTCSCYRFSLDGSLQSLKIALPQVLFSNIIYMQLYEQTREYLVRKLNADPLFSTACAAILGRLVVVSANIPLQSMRIRLSNQIKDRRINFHGYKITLVRDLPFSAFFWTSLQWYRNWVSKDDYRQTVRKGEDFSWKNITTNLIPGLVLGAMMSAVSTPFDTLKTRVQSQGIKSYSIPKSLLQIYHKEGLPGLFSGVQWRMLKNGVHSSLYVYIYEWYMRLAAGKTLSQ